MKFNVTALALSALVVMPAVAYAVTLQNTLGTIGDLIQTVTTLVAALALVYFFYGLGQLILGGAGDEKKRGAAIQTMIYGILALFVMFSVWGLIAILQETFDVGGSQNLDIPRIDL